MTNFTLFGPSFLQWILLACIFFSLEVLAPGAFFLWLGLATIPSALVKLAIPEISWQIQAILYAIFSIVSLFIWHRFARSNEEISTDQPQLNQRSQQYVGRTLTLSQAIENGFGKVTVEDSQWKVAGEDAAVNTKVKVISADGSVLNVESLL